VRDLIIKENIKGNHNRMDYEPTCLEIREFEDIKYVMGLAKSNRKVASTKCNDVSSRSHSIFELRL